MQRIQTIVRHKRKVKKKKFLTLIYIKLFDKVLQHARTRLDAL